MAFVHGFVKTTTPGRLGWCAPVELGESAAHYVSFVVPVDESGEFHERYVCETVVQSAGESRRETHELVKQGRDSFVLRLDGDELWFAVRPTAKEERRLPYVGGLGHPDFRHAFTEIQPVDFRAMDGLYDQKGIILVGCDPFTHYSGIETSMMLSS